MLEYIWFGGLTLVAALLARIYAIKDDTGEEIEAGQWLIGSMGAMVLALAISWERTGAVVFGLAKASLPQQGTQIADLTAVAITGLAVIAVVVGVPLGVAFLTYRYRCSPSHDGEAVR